MFVAAFYRRSQGWTKTWTTRPFSRPNSNPQLDFYLSNVKKDSPFVPFSGGLGKILLLFPQVRAIFASLLELSTFRHTL